jgi:AraC-like DNA-binding protein
MNLIQTTARIGSQQGQEIVYTLLGLRVLENIAGLTEDRVFRGQARPDRASSRKQFPHVRFYEGEAPNGRLPGHHHFWPELATVVEGRLDLAIGSEMYRAQRGDWFVVAPEVPHGECCNASRARYQLVWFELERPYPNLHLTQYDPATGYESFGVFGLPQLPLFLRASAGQLFGGSWPSTARARMHLLRLVNWIMELLDQSLHQAPSKISQQVLAVKETIAQSAETRPTVKELAARVGLSPNYLSSLFHRETRMTIRQYIANRQIEAAKNLLADPNATIKEVAYRLGFQDPFHFSNAFLRATGIRPSAYQSRSV